MKGSLVQLLLTAEPPLRSKVWVNIVAQGKVQLNLQGWRLHSLPGLPVPLLDCPHGGDIASHMQPGHVLSQFMPTVHLPPSRHSCEEPGSASSITSLLAQGRLQLDAPKAIPAAGWSYYCPQPPPTHHRATGPALSVLGTLCWTLFVIPISLESRNWAEYCRCDLMNTD